MADRPVHTAPRGADGIQKETGPYKYSAPSGARGRAPFCPLSRHWDRV
jgi:hypothetical protein